MSEKQFPVSDQKRAQLRSEGIIPFSLDIQTSALLLTMLLVIVFLGPKLFNEVLAEFEKHWKEAASSNMQNVTSVLGVTLKLTLLFVLPLALMQVVSGLLQSKFLLRFNAISLRFNSFFRNPFAGASRRVAVYFFGIVKVCIMLLLLGMLLYVSHEQVIVQNQLFSEKLFTDSQEMGLLLSQGVYSYYSSFRTWLLLIVGISCVYAMLSRIMVQIDYSQTHRMTREEMRAEMEDSEGDSTMKRHLRGQ
jgi:flagellar biosynthesis protein FlhB